MNSKAFDGVKAGLKITALFTLVTFTFTTLCWGGNSNLIAESIVSKNKGVETEWANPEQVSSNSLFDSLTLPEELGHIKSTFRGSSGKVIIHIQDAHVNEEAQRNIAAILKHFSTYYGLKRVSLEGAEGRLYPEVFSFFPDQEARRIAADYFLKEGRFSGPEYLAIVENPGIELYGIEDRALYQANRKAYLDALQFKQEDEEIIAGIGKTLHAAARHIFSSEALDLLSKHESLVSDGEQLIPYVQTLSNLAQKYNISVDSYPGVSRLVKVLDLGHEINFEKAGKDVAALVQALKLNLPKERLAKFLYMTAQFQMNQIRRPVYYEFIEQEAGKLNASGSKALEPYSDVLKYMHYTRLYDEINSDIFEEFEKLEEAVKTKLYTSEDARMLDRRLKIQQITERLFAFTLTKQDAEYFYAHKIDFKSAALRDAVEPVLIKNRFSMRLPDQLDVLDRDIERVQKFYEAAIQRDPVLIGNAIHNMEDGNQMIGAVVTGGFHTPGIEKYLRDHDYSYIVITPRISNVDEAKSSKLYEEALSGKPVALEKVLTEAFLASQKTSVLNDPRFQLAVEPQTPNAAALEAMAAGIPINAPAITTLTSYMSPEGGLAFWGGYGAIVMNRQVAGGNYSAVLSSLEGQPAAVRNVADPFVKIFGNSAAIGRSVLFQPEEGKVAVLGITDSKRAEVRAFIGSRPLMTAEMSGGNRFYARIVDEDMLLPEMTEALAKAARSEGRAAVSAPAQKFSLNKVQRVSEEAYRLESGNSSLIESAKEAYEKLGRVDRSLPFDQWVTALVEIEKTFTDEFGGDLEYRRLLEILRAFENAGATDIDIYERLNSIRVRERLHQLILARVSEWSKTGFSVKDPSQAIKNLKAYYKAYPLIYDADLHLNHQKGLQVLSKILDAKRIKKAEDLDVETKDLIQTIMKAELHAATREAGVAEMMATYEMEYNTVSALRRHTTAILEVIREEKPKTVGLAALLASKGIKDSPENKEKDSYDFRRAIVHEAVVAISKRLVSSVAAVNDMRARLKEDRALSAEETRDFRRSLDRLENDINATILNKTENGSRLQERFEHARRVIAQKRERIKALEEVKAEAPAPVEAQKISLSELAGNIIHSRITHALGIIAAGVTVTALIILFPVAASAVTPWVLIGAILSVIGIGFWVFGPKMYTAFQFLVTGAYTSVAYLGEMLKKKTAEDGVSQLPPSAPAPVPARVASEVNVGKGFDALGLLDEAPVPGGKRLTLDDLRALQQELIASVRESAQDEVDAGIPAGTRQEARSAEERMRARAAAKEQARARTEEVKGRYVEAVLQLIKDQIGEVAKEIQVADVATLEALDLEAVLTARINPILELPKQFRDVSQLADVYKKSIPAMISMAAKALVRLQILRLQEEYKKRVSAIKKTIDTLDRSQLPGEEVAALPADYADRQAVIVALITGYAGKFDTAMSEAGVQLGEEEAAPYRNQLERETQAVEGLTAHFQSDAAELKRLFAEKKSALEAINAEEAKLKDVYARLAGLSQLADNDLTLVRLDEAIQLKAELSNLSASTLVNSFDDAAKMIATGRAPEGSAEQMIAGLEARYLTAIQKRKADIIDRVRTAAQPNAPNNQLMAAALADAKTLQSEIPQLQVNHKPLYEKAEHDIRHLDYEIHQILHPTHYGKILTVSGMIAVGLALLIGAGYWIYTLIASWKSVATPEPVTAVTASSVPYVMIGAVIIIGLVALVVSFIAVQLYNQRVAGGSIEEMREELAAEAYFQSVETQIGEAERTINEVTTVGKDTDGRIELVLTAVHDSWTPPLERKYADRVAIIEGRIAGLALLYKEKTEALKQTNTREAFAALDKKINPEMEEAAKNATHEELSKPDSKYYKEDQYKALLASLRATWDNEVAGMNGRKETFVDDYEGLLLQAQRAWESRMRRLKDVYDANREDVRRKRVSETAIELIASARASVAEKDQLLAGFKDERHELFDESHFKTTVTGPLETLRDQQVAELKGNVDFEANKDAEQVTLVEVFWTGALENLTRTYSRIRAQIEEDVRRRKEAEAKQEAVKRIHAALKAILENAKREESPEPITADSVNKAHELVAEMPGAEIIRLMPDEAVRQQAGEIANLLEQIETAFITATREELMQDLQAVSDLLDKVQAKDVPYPDKIGTDQVGDKVVDLEKKLLPSGKYGEAFASRFEIEVTEWAFAQMKVLDERHDALHPAKALEKVAGKAPAAKAPAVPAPARQKEVVRPPAPSLAPEIKATLIQRVQSFEGFARQAAGLEGDDEVSLRFQNALQAADARTAMESLTRAIGEIEQVSIAAVEAGSKNDQTKVDIWTRARGVLDAEILALFPDPGILRMYRKTLARKISPLTTDLNLLAELIIEEDVTAKTLTAESSEISALATMIAAAISEVDQISLQGFNEYVQTRTGAEKTPLSLAIDQTFKLITLRYGFLELATSYGGFEFLEAPLREKLQQILPAVQAPANLEEAPETHLEAAPVPLPAPAKVETTSKTSQVEKLLAKAVTEISVNNVADLALNNFDTLGAYAEFARGSELQKRLEIFEDEAIVHIIAEFNGDKTRARVVWEKLSEFLENEATQETVTPFEALSAYAVKLRGKMAQLETKSVVDIFEESKGIAAPAPAPLQQTGHLETAGAGLDTARLPDLSTTISAPDEITTLDQLAAARIVLAARYDAHEQALLDVEPGSDIRALLAEREALDAEDARLHAIELRLNSAPSPAPAPVPVKVGPEIVHEVGTSPEHTALLRLVAHFNAQSGLSLLVSENATAALTSIDYAAASEEFLGFIVAAFELSIRAAQSNEQKISILTRLAEYLSSEEYPQLLVTPEVLSFHERIERELSQAHRAEARRTPVEEIRLRQEESLARRKKMRDSAAAATGARLKAQFAPAQLEKTLKSLTTVEAVHGYILKITAAAEAEVESYRTLYGDETHSIAFAGYEAAMLFYEQNEEAINDLIDERAREIVATAAAPKSKAETLRAPAPAAPVEIEKIQPSGVLEEAEVAPRLAEDKGGVLTQLQEDLIRLEGVIQRVIDEDPADLERSLKQELNVAPTSNIDAVYSVLDAFAKKYTGLIGEDREARLAIILEIVQFINGTGKKANLPAKAYSVDVHDLLHSYLNEYSYLKSRKEDYLKGSSKKVADYFIAKLEKRANPSDEVLAGIEDVRTYFDVLRPLLSEMELLLGSSPVEGEQEIYSYQALVARFEAAINEVSRKKFELGTGPAAPATVDRSNALGFWIGIAIAAVLAGGLFLGVLWTLKTLPQFSKAGKNNVPAAALKSILRSESRQETGAVDQSRVQAIKQRQEESRARRERMRRAVANAIGARLKSLFAVDNIRKALEKLSLIEDVEGYILKIGRDAETEMLQLKKTYGEDTYAIAYKGYEAAMHAYADHEAEIESLIDQRTAKIRETAASKPSSSPAPRPDAAPVDETLGKEKAGTETLPLEAPGAPALLPAQTAGETASLAPAASLPAPAEKPAPEEKGPTRRTIDALLVLIAGILGIGAWVGWESLFKPLFQDRSRSVAGTFEEAADFTEEEARHAAEAQQAPAPVIIRREAAAEEKEETPKVHEPLVAAPAPVVATHPDADLPLIRYPQRANLLAAPGFFPGLYTASAVTTAGDGTIDFKITDMTGENRNFSRVVRDRVTLVVTGSPLDPYFRRHVLPKLREQWRALQPLGLQIVILAPSGGGNRASLNRALDEMNLDIPVILDTEGAGRTMAGSTEAKYFFIENNRVHRAGNTAPSWADLIERLQYLLPSSKPPVTAAQRTLWGGRRPLYRNGLPSLAMDGLLPELNLAQRRDIFNRDSESARFASASTQQIPEDFEVYHVSTFDLPTEGGRDNPRSQFNVLEGRRKLFTKFATAMGFPSTRDDFFKPADWYYYIFRPWFVSQGMGTDEAAKFMVALINEAIPEKLDLYAEYFQYIHLGPNQKLDDFFKDYRSRIVEGLMNTPKALESQPWKRPAWSLQMWDKLEEKWKQQTRRGDASGSWAPIGLKYFLGAAMERAREGSWLQQKNLKGITRELVVRNRIPRLAAYSDANLAEYYEYLDGLKNYAGVVIGGVSGNVRSLYNTYAKNKKPGTTLVQTDPTTGVQTLIRSNAASSMLILGQGPSKQQTVHYPGEYLVIAVYDPRNGGSLTMPDEDPTSTVSNGYRRSRLRVRLTTSILNGPTQRLTESSSVLPTHTEYTVSRRSSWESARAAIRTNATALGLTTANGYTLNLTEPLASINYESARSWGRIIATKQGKSYLVGFWEKGVLFLSKDIDVAAESPDARFGQFFSDNTVFQIATEPLDASSLTGRRRIWNLATDGSTFKHYIDPEGWSRLQARVMMTISDNDNSNPFYDGRTNRMAAKIHATEDMIQQIRANRNEWLIRRGTPPGGQSTEFLAQQLEQMLFLGRDAQIRAEGGSIGRRRPRNGGRAPVTSFGRNGARYNQPQGASTILLGSDYDFTVPRTRTFNVAPDGRLYVHESFFEDIADNPLFQTYIQEYFNPLTREKMQNTETFHERMSTLRPILLENGFNPMFDQFLERAQRMPFEMIEAAYVGEGPGMMKPEDFKKMKDNFENNYYFDRTNIVTRFQNAAFRTWFFDSFSYFFPPGELNRLKMITQNQWTETYVPALRAKGQPRPLTIPRKGQANEHFGGVRSQWELPHLPGSSERVFQLFLGGGTAGTGNTSTALRLITSAFTDDAAHAPFVHDRQNATTAPGNVSSNYSLRFFRRYAPKNVSKRFNAPRRELPRSVDDFARHVLFVTLMNNQNWANRDASNISELLGTGGEMRNHIQNFVAVMKSNVFQDIFRRQLGDFIVDDYLNRLLTGKISEKVILDEEEGYILDGVQYVHKLEFELLKVVLKPAAYENLKRGNLAGLKLSDFTEALPRQERNVLLGILRMRPRNLNPNDLDVPTGSNLSEDKLTEVIHAQDYYRAFYSYTTDIFRLLYTSVLSTWITDARKEGVTTSAEIINLFKMQIALQPAVEKFYGIKLNLLDPEDAGRLRAFARDFQLRGIDPSSAVLALSLATEPQVRREALAVFNALTGQNLTSFSILSRDRKISAFHTSFLIWWATESRNDENFTRWATVLTSNTDTAALIRATDRARVLTNGPRVAELMTHSDRIGKALARAVNAKLDVNKRMKYTSVAPSTGRETFSNWERYDRWPTETRGWFISFIRGNAVERDWDDAAKRQLGQLATYLEGVGNDSDGKFNELFTETLLLFKNVTGNTTLWETADLSNPVKGPSQTGALISILREGRGLNTAQRIQRVQELNKIATFTYVKVGREIKALNQIAELAARQQAINRGRPLAPADVARERDLLLARINAGDTTGKDIGAVMSMIESARSESIRGGDVNKAQFERWVSDTDTTLGRLERALRPKDKAQAPAIFRQNETALAGLDVKDWARETARIIRTLPIDRVNAPELPDIEVVRANDTGIRLRSLEETQEGVERNDRNRPDRRPVGPRVASAGGSRQKPAGGDLRSRRNFLTAGRAESRVPAPAPQVLKNQETPVAVTEERSEVRLAKVATPAVPGSVENKITNAIEETASLSGRGVNAALQGNRREINDFNDRLFAAVSVELAAIMDAARKAPAATARVNRNGQIIVQYNAAIHGNHAQFVKHVHDLMANAPQGVKVRVYAEVKSDAFAIATADQKYSGKIEFIDSISGVIATALQQQTVVQLIAGEGTAKSDAQRAAIEAAKLSKETVLLLGMEKPVTGATPMYLEAVLAKARIEALAKQKTGASA